MPHDVLVAPLNEMHRLIRTVVDAGVAVFAIFGPHRCAQDGPTERVGTERVNSVIEHALALYPSPHPQRSGCIEVRFIGTPADPTMTPLTSRHERFIDYGPVEALAYARFTAGLGYASRLAPLVLASVDPQAFWAACMRVDDFVTTLSELSNVPAAVSAAWLTLRDGMEGVIKACRKTYLKFVAWGRDGTWSQDLTSAERHLDIAQDGAYCGMYMTMDRIEREGSSLKQRGGVRFHMLDDTKDTEMGKLFESMMMGPGSSIQDINATLKGLGHGDDPLGLAQDPMASCGACGKTDGPLRKCTACQGQVYCSDKCQRTHWPTHKKYCSRLLVKLRESRDRFEARGGSMDMKTHPGNVPATSMPASMMSEASGVGTASIFWNPGGESFITFKDYPKERRGDELDISDAEMSSSESSNDDMIKFGSLSELPAPIRFLVCCGPLQDLAVAKESLEELLTSERWQLPGADAAMQIVPSAKFTALEWAAKKGNLAVVEWLCTDERTKRLVNEGSPVGWACYTGRIECAKLLVRHGADPSATNVVLWNHLPPLMVAAQNGQLEALQWLVDEIGVDLRSKDATGKSVVHHIKVPKNWEDCPGHVACLEWVNRRLGSKNAPALKDPYTLGKAVKIQGLQSKPELNGAKATLLAKDEASGRFAVRVTEMPDGSVPTTPLEMKLKPASIALQ